MKDLIYRLENSKPEDERGLLKDCARLAFQRNWITVAQNNQMLQLIEAGGFTDAALILMPKGWYVNALHQDIYGKGWFCHLTPNCKISSGYAESGITKQLTSALALASAAFKARG